MINTPIDTNDRRGIMRYFSQFKKIQEKLISETTLQPRHQDRVDMWAEDRHSEVDEDTQNKLNTAFGNGNHVVIPLTSSGSEAHPDVAEHLENHGWSIHDYKQGIAGKKTMVGNPERGIPMREKFITKKIGAILNDTNAHDDVKNAFANDPARQAQSKKQQHIVISQHPYAVAGVSTGTSWSSCMNMDSGCNRHYLPYDIAHGTHVAYLVDHDDETGIKDGVPSKPKARISLKPFHAEDDDTGERDTIFRPEPSLYGNASNDFVSAVSNWAVKNFPAKDDAIYEKNPDVYHDSGSRYYTNISKAAATEYLSGSRRLPNQAYDHDVINHMVQHVVKKHEEGDHISAGRAIENIAGSVGNLGTAHINKLYNVAKSLTGEPAVSTTAMMSVIKNHGNRLSRTNFNDAWSRSNGVPHKQLIMNPNINDDQVDTLHPDSYKYLHPDKLKPKHVQKVIDGYLNNESGSAYHIRAVKSKLTPEHLKSIVTKTMKTGMGTVGNYFGLDHPSFTKDVHDHVINMAASGHRLIHPAQFLKTSPHASVSDLDKLYPNGDYDKSHLEHLGENNNITEADQKEIKNRIVNNVVGGNYGNSVSFSENIGKHLTTDDMDKLIHHSINNNYRGYHFFDNPEHSNNFLYRITHHLKQADDELTEENNNWTSDTTEEPAKKKFDNLVELHHNVLDNHIDYHVESDDPEEEGPIKNHDEHRRARNHLNNVFNLDNFNEHDHDWHLELDNKLNRLESDHDDFENNPYRDDNW